MAVGEDLIDGVYLPLAVAGRRAGPERVSEDMAWHGLPSHPPAGHAPGLARQVIKRQLEDLEPAAEMFAIDQAIGRRGSEIMLRLEVRLATITRGCCAWKSPGLPVAD